jgi:hypothetical protein
MNYVVKVGHDEIEGRYYVLESDINGLNVESGTFEEFVEIGTELAPVLIGDHPVGSKIIFEQEVLMAS